VNAARLCSAIVVILAVVCGVTPTARAQELHAWFVVQTTSKDGATKASIVHLTPPTSMAPRGSVRNVQWLWRAPEHLAWAGSTVYLLMPPERVGKDRVERRVYSIAAVPGLVAGWEYLPPDRPQTLPTLGKEFGARECVVEGFAADAWSPAVLLKKDTGERTLAVLQGASWVRAPLPWEGDRNAAAPRASDRCHLVSCSKSIGVLVERATPGGAGTGTWYLATGRPGDAVPGRSAWSAQELSLAPPSGAGRESDVFCSVENQLLRVSVVGQTLSLSVLKGSGEFLVTTLHDIGVSARVGAVEGAPGYLAILTGQAPAAPTGTEVEATPSAKSETAYRIIELSPTGRVLYDGPAKQGGPVSQREVLVLTVLLVIVMAAVILFVLRPEKKRSSAIALPKGLMPAESSRRIMATILDMGAAWVVASLMVRVDLTDVARPEVVFATSRGWLAVGAALTVNFVSGVILEWQFGMTLGKMLLGSRVMALPPEPPVDRPAGETTPRPVAPGISLLAAVVRNVAKWTPWSMGEFLFTGRSRPWSDRISKTVVVVPDATDQEQGG
jgi:hypothetical protein